jgi:hypothetical protein
LLIKDAVNSLPAPEQRAFRQLFEASKEWLEDFSIADLYSLETVMSNLQNGYSIPEAYRLKNKIEVLRNQRANTDAATEAVLGSKATGKLIGHGFTNAANRFFQRAKMAVSAKARQKFSEKRNAIRELAATDKYRIDNLLGNFSKVKTFYSQYMNANRGVQQESNVKQKYEKVRQGILSKFSKNYKAAKGEKPIDKLKEVVNFLNEERHQNHDNFKKGNVNENNASRNDMGFKIIAEQKKAIGNKSQFKKEKDRWHKQFQEAKKNGLTKEVNGVEVLDVEKYREWLRKDNAVAEFMDDYKTYLEEIEPYTKASTMENNRSFRREEFYTPFINKESGGEVNPNSVLAEIAQGDFVPRMQAGATYSMKGGNEWLENDPIRILELHTNDVLRNYYVKPEIENSLKAIKNSFDTKAKELTEEQRIDAHILRDALMVDIKDAVQKYYNSGKYAYEQNRTQDKFINRAKQGMLLHPARIPAELGSNLLRQGWMSKPIPRESIFMERKRKRGLRYNS